MRYHDAEPYLVRMEAENGLNYSLAHPTNGPSFADPRPHYFDSSGRAHFYTAEQYEAAYLKAHWEQVKISGYAGMNMYFGLLGAARGAAFTPQPTPARSYSQTALYTASRSPYTPCPDTLLRRVDLTTKGAANPKERNFRPTPKDHNQLSTWTTPKLLRDKTNKGQTTAWAEIHTNGVPKEAIYTDKPGHWMIDFWHPEVTAEKLVNSIIRTGVVQAREQRYPRK